VRRLVLAATLLAPLLVAAPASAANPVLDPEDDAEIAEALAEATEVQDVCYGYVLAVDDGDTGEWGGAYAASSGGAGVRATDADGCSDGVVELVARISYTSDFSDAEDSASWELVSDVPGLSIGDVEDQGLSSGDLLDDGASAAVLQNAVLSLPRLAAERAGLEPVVLEPNASPLPDGARPTGTPGSDWLRENLVLLGLSVAAVLAGLVALVAAFPRGRRGRPVPAGGPRARPTSRTHAVPPPSSRPRDPWSTG
jgi:hypothetical protein